MKIRQIFCVPTESAAWGASAQWLPLTKTRGVKLFYPAYNKAHVLREAEVMQRAAKLGLGPSVFGVVFVVEGKVVRWGIEVETVQVIPYGSNQIRRDTLPRLRRDILKKMRLMNADVRPENIGLLRGKVVCIDWSLARLVPQHKMTGAMNEEYTLSTLNDSRTARRSLRPNDPCI